MKIAWKVALATLCILVVFFGAGSCLLISLSFRSALAREVDVAQEELQMLRLSYVAVCVARGITMENMFKQGRSVARVLEENRYFAGRQFRVTTESGRKVYSTMEAASDQELLEEIDDSSRGYSIRRDEKTGRVFIHCADTVTLDNGVLYLESARDITSLFADRAVHYRIYRYLLLAVVSAAVGVLYLTSVWLTRPIRDLGKAANRLAAGDYTSRAEVAGGDEVSELAEKFNQMADAVEKNVHAPAESAQRQEDFTARDPTSNLNLAHAIELLRAGQTVYYREKFETVTWDDQRLIISHTVEAYPEGEFQLPAQDTITIDLNTGAGLELLVPAAQGEPQENPLENFFEKLLNG